ncbi:MAG TPA: DUF1326 domain-containing protein [Thermoanaerobaculia bacterium]|nr:DUF1326 domain-containing protein [Thermoanaerobaculia bacterium]
MKKLRWVFAFLAMSIPALPVTAISGHYLEARTSDVYTGSCFANGEVNLAGREAVMAWQVREGSWKGVAVDGLSIVAAVRAAATLGDPFANPYPAQAVVVVDERATPAQRDALVGFAREMAGDLLANVVAVEAAPIEMTVEGKGGHSHHGGGGSAALQVGDLIELRTRSLNHTDHLCGNEEVYYSPLAEVDGAVPAVTLAHSFRGQGLGMTWSSPDKRSAFVASFSR